MSLALGYPHPDVMLKQLTSKQLGEWMAFAMLEQVGNPVQADPQDAAEQEAKTKRDTLRSWFKEKARG